MLNKRIKIAHKHTSFEKSLQFKLFPYLPVSQDVPVYPDAQIHPAVPFVTSQVPLLQATDAHRSDGYEWYIVS